MARKQFPYPMLKIPTFVLSGLLILTGLAGYLLQDPGLSIKLTGPLAGNAKLTLSDGNETHEIDLGFASSDAPGEHAYWLINRLNTTHAKDASQGNYAVDKGRDRYKKKSFWYGSSKGETLAALMQDAENYQNASNQPVPIEWSKVDQNSSTIKFVYKNEAGNSGPATLQVSNWKNIDVEPKPKPNAKLEFKRSWTALIPGIIGIVLILLVLLAEAKPSARKHVMHGAVLLGLLGFIMVAKRIIPAVSEMNWLKGEPNAIIQTSSLKPATMLISAGLLLIFIILCVVSFIQARKDMAAQAKKDATAKKKEPKDKSEDKVEKKKESSNSEESKHKEDKRKDDEDAPDGSGKEDDSNKDKRPGGSGGPAKKFPRSPTRGLPIRKPVDKTGKKASFDLKSKKDFRTPEDTDDKKGGEEKKEEEGTDTETKKESVKDDGVSREKPEDEKSGDSGARKDSDEESDKDDAPSPAMKEPEETPENKEDDSDTETKKDSEEDTGFSYKKPDDEKSDDSGEQKDSDEESDKDDEPSPAMKESEESLEKKGDDSDAEEKKDFGNSEDSSDDRPEEK